MRAASRLRAAIAGAATVAVVVGATGVGVAQSGRAKGKIVADAGQLSRMEATKIARTIAGPKVIRSAAFAARPPYGRVAARSTKPLTGFPPRPSYWLGLPCSDSCGWQSEREERNGGHARRSDSEVRARH